MNKPPEAKTFVVRQIEELLNNKITPLKISRILNIDFRVICRLIDNLDNQKSDINEKS